MYPRNAGTPPRIAIGAVVAFADGAVQTADVSIKVTPEGGAAGAGGGTTSYVEGIVHYAPTQAETNHTAFTVTAYKADCIPVSATVVTTATAVAGTVDVGAVSGDSTAADNCKAMFDGTGYAGGTTKLSVEVNTKTGFKLASDGLDAVVKLKALLDGTPSGEIATDADPRTTTAFETTLTEATDDHCNGAFIVFYSGALTGQSRKISDYDGTAKVVTVATAFTEAPAVGDGFLIIGRSE